MAWPGKELRAPEQRGGAWCSPGCFFSSKDKLAQRSGAFLLLLLTAICISGVAGTSQQLSPLWGCAVAMSAAAVPSAQSCSNRSSRWTGEAARLDLHFLQIFLNLFLLPAFFIQSFSRLPFTIFPSLALSTPNTFQDARAGFSPACRGVMPPLCCLQKWAKPTILSPYITSKSCIFT